jgi:hypothetical protein
MTDPSHSDQPFDWQQLPVDPDDPHTVARKLQGYIESQIRSGHTEDAIREQLLVAHVPPDYITDLFLVVHEAQRGKVKPDQVLRGRPYPIFPRAPYAFEALAQAEAERSRRRKDRQERKQKSARVASSEPDPAFALDDSPSYGQILARQANRESKLWWLGFLILGLVSIPILIVLVWIFGL